MRYLSAELGLSPFQVHLRKFILASICLLAGFVAQAQPGKPSVRQFVRIDAVATASQIGKQAINIAPDSAFKLGSDGLLVSGQIQENAHCRDGKTDWMRFGKARFHADTLFVSLFRTDRRYVYELETKVWRGEFTTTYRITARDGGSGFTVLATDQVLVLEKMDLERGLPVTGFINFRGTRWEQKPPARPWEAKMDWVESTYVVRGPFKITIDK